MHHLISELSFVIIITFVVDTIWYGKQIRISNQMSMKAKRIVMWQII